jgi:hypothetical protein
MVQHLTNRLHQQEHIQSTQGPTQHIKTEKIEIQPFDGEDSALYPQFETVLRAKFSLEAAKFPSPESKVWFAVGKLKGKAARLMSPWTEEYKDNPLEFTVERFFYHMKQQFGDVDRQRKALDQLQKLRQGNRTFEDLLAEFQRLMLESGAGRSWTTAMKISSLQNAMSFKLQQATITLVNSPTFDEHVRTIRQVADRLESLERRRHHRTAYPANQTLDPTEDSARAAHRRPYTNTTADNRMDWEPTPRGAAVIPSGRRARRVDAREIQRRKDEHRCLRCGSSEHFINRCPHKAPKADGGPTARSARVKVEADIEDDTSDESEEGDQGKE